MSLKDTSEDNYTGKVNHFTSPALEYILDNYSSIPNKVLNQEEIHAIARKASEYGVSKILWASSTANKYFAGQLKTLFTLEKTEDDNLGVPDNINHNIYGDYVDIFKKKISKEWIENFINNIAIVHNRDISDHKKAIWNAAFHPKEFQKNLDDDFNEKNKSNENIKVDNEDPMTKVNKLLNKFQHERNMAAKPKPP